MTDSEDYEDLLPQLAEYLADLSAYDGELPRNFQSTRIDRVEADDIAWDSNDWLNTIAEIQDWLHLDQKWNPEAGTVQDAATKLFALLGSEDPAKAFDCDANCVRLTLDGVETLMAWAAVAVSHQEKFTSFLDEGDSLADATVRWEELWEDSAAEQTSDPVEVHASVDTWKIKEFIDLAEARELELNPSYQRDSVWPLKTSQSLIDSILRGIPLPSVILNTRDDNKNINEIVDGKQRLTAILRFIGRHPDGIDYAKRQDPEGGQAAIRNDFRKWARKNGVKAAAAKEKYLPFPVGKCKNPSDPLYRLNGRYYCEIKDERITVSGQQTTVSQIFEGASKIYAIPLIIYTSTAISQIQRVFGLYNSQGKQLNKEELRNAIFHHLDLTKLILVLGGDHRGPADSVLKPELLEANEFGQVRELFKTMSVGVNRFHCSKLTGWTIAFTCFDPPRKPSGDVNTPATAGYIDGMLKCVDKNRDHACRSPGGLKQILRDVVEGAELLLYLHDEEQAVAAGFTSTKDSGSLKWDDLPAVAALTACVFARVGGLSGRPHEDLVEAFRAATESAALAPPKKQQTRTQWAYMARTVLTLLKALEVDVEGTEGKLVERYGSTGLTTLIRIAEGALGS